MFVPKPKKKKLKPETHRKQTTIMVIVGEERKARYDQYCKDHGTNKTEMLKQMIDYCMATEETRV